MREKTFVVLSKNLIFIILLLFFGGIFINATKLNILISENSSQTKLLSGTYTIKANGIITIKNPSLVSKVYGIRIPLKLDSLIGINKVNYPNLTNDFTFSFSSIKGSILNENSSVSFGYEIFGIVSYDLYSKLKPQESIFEHYSSEFELTSNLLLNLQKPTRENESLINDTRLISAGLRNPTDFDYFAKKLTIYKTDTADPFFNNGEELSNKFNLTIKPFDYKEFDFYDRTSRNNSVYWISSDVVIKYDKNVSINRKTLVQNPVQNSGGRGGGGGGGGSFNFINKVENSSVKLDTLFIKKEVSSNIIRKGKEFEVILRVVNVNDFSLNNLTIYDEVPNGYEIKEVSESVKITDGKNLRFDIKKIDSYDTYVIKYKLIYNENLKGISYLKPAKLIYNNLEYFSEGVLLINELLSKKKIYVQKEIEYYDDKFAKITIRVKNLGGIELRNLIIKDNLGKNLIIKDISKVFYNEKGVWLINTLKSGEEWEVSYLIERNSNLDSLPNVFGVPNSDVFGTIVASDEVRIYFQEEPSIIEKVGIGIAAFLLILYLLF